MQRDREMCHKYEISHLKKLPIGNDLQGHSRSLQFLLLDRPYTSITSCCGLLFQHFRDITCAKMFWFVSYNSCGHRLILPALHYASMALHLFVCVCICIFVIRRYCIETTAQFMLVLILIYRLPSIILHSVLRKLLYLQTFPLELCPKLCDLQNLAMAQLGVKWQSYV